MATWVLSEPRAGISIPNRSMGAHTRTFITLVVRIEVVYKVEPIALH